MKTSRCLRSLAPLTFLAAALLAPALAYAQPDTATLTQPGTSSTATVVTAVGVAPVAVAQSADPVVVPAVTAVSRPTRPAATTTTTTYARPAVTASAPVASVEPAAATVIYATHDVDVLPAVETSRAASGALPSIPPMPDVLEKDVRGYAYIWTGKEWTLLPRNGARVLRRPSEAHPEHTRFRQYIGTLVLDGVAKPSAVSGKDRVILAFHGHLRGFSGTSASQSPIEITRLEYLNDSKLNPLARAATLERIGRDAATFGARAESVTVEQRPNKFFVISVNTALTPGRYALYIPDRAFEFEIL